MQRPEYDGNKSFPRFSSSYKGKDTNPFHEECTDTNGWLIYIIKVYQLNFLKPEVIIARCYKLFITLHVIRVKGAQNGVGLVC